MADIDEKAADTPVEQQIASAPIVSASLDAQVGKAIASTVSQPEQSVYNGPVELAKGSNRSQNAAKRKQSKIRMDSDEEEGSDEQPTVCVLTILCSPNT